MSNELKAIKQGSVELGEYWVYDADDVDALLAKKDKEIAELKARIQLDDDEMAGFLQLEEECGGGDLRNYIAELKHKLDDAQAKVYADSIDAWKRERRLRRALWLARAESAKNAKCRYHRLAQKEVCDPQPHGWSCYINGEVYPTGKMSRKLEPHYWCDIWDEVERKCRAKAEEYK